MPASAVTSVNSIGPEGRGGVGLGDGDATAAAVSVAGAAGAAVGACLHPDKTTTTKKKVNNHLLVLSNLFSQIDAANFCAFGASLWLKKISISIAVGPTRNNAYSGAFTT